MPADIVKNILKNKNIIIHSDGTPTRTFCYISDAIIGYLKVLSFSKFDIFNIGHDRDELNVTKFAKLFLNLYKNEFNKNCKSTIKYKKSLEKNYLKDNPKRRCPDINKARKLLKFSPQVNLNKGLFNYLNFLKYNND